MPPNQRPRGRTRERLGRPRRERPARPLVPDDGPEVAGGGDGDDVAFPRGDRADVWRGRVPPAGRLIRNRRGRADGRHAPLVVHHPSPNHSPARAGDDLPRPVASRDGGQRAHGFSVARVHRVFQSSTAPREHRPVGVARDEHVSVEPGHERAAQSVCRLRAVPVAVSVVAHAQTRGVSRVRGDSARGCGGGCASPRGFGGFGGGAALRPRARRVRVRVPRRPQFDVFRAERGESVRVGTPRDASNLRRGAAAVPDGLVDLRGGARGTREFSAPIPHANRVLRVGRHRDESRGDAPRGRVPVPGTERDRDDAHISGRVSKPRHLFPGRRLPNHRAGRATGLTRRRPTTGRVHGER